MKILISPAKKMVDTRDSFSPTTLPIFLKEAEELLCCLKGLNQTELKRLLKCNDDLVQLNWQRIQNNDVKNADMMALVTYQGLQYQEMAAHVFSDSAWEYAKRHIFIVSGLYGLLKPTDAVIQYRLEMQAKLQVGKHKDLYSYWNDKIAQEIFKSNETVLNLASKEYSKVFINHTQNKVITCVFGVIIGGEVKVKGTLAKMARGSMVRYCAENNIQDIQEVKKFSGHGFVYDENASTDYEWVFLKR